MESLLALRNLRGPSLVKGPASRASSRSVGATGRGRDCADLSLFKVGSGGQTAVASARSAVGEGGNPSTAS